MSRHLQGFLARDQRLIEVLPGHLQFGQQPVGLVIKVPFRRSLTADLDGLEKVHLCALRVSGALSQLTRVLVVDGLLPQEVLFLCQLQGLCQEPLASLKIAPQIGHEAQRKQVLAQAQAILGPLVVLKALLQIPLGLPPFARKSIHPPQVSANKSLSLGITELLRKLSGFMQIFY